MNFFQISGQKYINLDNVQAIVFTGNMTESGMESVRIRFLGEETNESMSEYYLSREQVHELRDRLRI